MIERVEGVARTGIPRVESSFVLFFFGWRRLRYALRRRPSYCGVVAVAGVVCVREWLCHCCCSRGCFRGVFEKRQASSPKTISFENPRHVYCQPVHNACQLILPYLYLVNIDIFFLYDEFILNSPFHSLSFSTYCSSSGHAAVRNPSSGRNDSRDIQSTNQMATKRARSCRCSGE